MVPPSGSKIDIVKSLMDSTDGRILVFTRTKNDADTVGHSINSAAGRNTAGVLHGGINQSGRDRVMADFRQGTDAAAAVVCSTDMVLSVSHFPANWCCL